MIFDTHAHYDDRKFDADRREVLAAMPAKGVSAEEMTRITQENGCRLFGIEA